MAQFTNQAQLTYNDMITNSNVAVGEVTEVLSATKTALRNEYARNDAVTYVISIVNGGTVPFTGVTVTDNLGQYQSGTQELYPLTYIAGTLLYYVNGTLQATPTIATTEPFSISNITIPAGSNVMLIYEAEVNGYAPLAIESTITNEAVISGNGITDLTVTETVSAETGPMLSITKSISPVPVAENGRVTYTFLIQNTGNTGADEVDAAAITDIFNPVLTDLTVTFNGTTWEEGTNYTYDVATGTFTTVPGQIQVPAATFTQDETSGAWLITPGVSTLTVTGTI